MTEMTDIDQAEKLGDGMAEVIRTVNSGCKRVVGYELYDDDTIGGIFEGKDGFYLFELGPDNDLGFDKLQFKARNDTLDDPFWQGFAERNDGKQIKKTCVNSVECGEGCIPHGAICHQGLPTPQQGRVIAIRAALKASRKVARAAAAVAVGAGMTALAVYAAKKAHDSNLGDRIKRAGQSVGLSPEAMNKMQAFAQSVAEQMKAPDPLISALKPKDPPPKPKNFVEKVRDQVGESVNGYVNAWRKEPAATAMAHLSVGLLLYGSEQAGEHLGYIPKGALHRAVGAEAMRERFKKRNSPKRNTNVRSRTTSYGA